MKNETDANPYYEHVSDNPMCQIEINIWNACDAIKTFVTFYFNYEIHRLSGDYVWFLLGKILS